MRRGGKKIIFVILYRIQFNLDSQYLDHGENTINVKYMLVLLVDVLRGLSQKVIHRRLYCTMQLKLYGTVE